MRVTPRQDRLVGVRRRHIASGEEEHEFKVSECIGRSAALSVFWNERSLFGSFFAPYVQKAGALL
jgi:hypothetical protein